MPCNCDNLLNILCTLGADKKTTILDYMVKTLIDKGEHKLLDITEDFEMLDRVTKLSGTEILKDMESLEKNYAVIKQDNEKFGVSSNEMDSLYAQRLHMKFEEFTLAISNIRRYQSIMKNKVVEAVEYFGEDTHGSYDTTKVFGTLHLFCKSIQESRVTVDRRSRSEVRNNNRPTSSRSNSRDRK